MKNDKEKGIFLIEVLTALGIFSIFMSLTVPLINGSIKIKNTARKELRYNRNFSFILENIQKEIRNNLYVKILDNEKGIELVNNIYENGKVKECKTIYEFIGSDFPIGNMYRYVIKDGEENLKKDIIFENIRGRFFQEDGFIKLRISYTIFGKEEEYICR